MLHWRNSLYWSEYPLHMEWPGQWFHDWSHFGVAVSPKSFIQKFSAKDRREDESYDVLQAYIPWNPLRRTISNLIIIHVDTRDHSSSESSTSEREVSETPYRATTISITLADRADQGLRLAVPHIIIYERHSRRVFETRLFESATRHGAKFSPSSCHATRMHRKPIYSLLRRSYHRYAVTRAAYHHHSCSLFSQSAPLGVCAHPHPRACW